jgi:hypothetical protein
MPSATRKRVPRCQPQVLIRQDNKTLKALIMPDGGEPLDETKLRGGQ